MQTLKSKKVWFFVVLGIVAIATVCFMKSAKNEKKVYINGRVVEKETTLNKGWCEA